MELDLEKLIHWGVGQVVTRAERQVKLPLGDVVAPLANAGIDYFNIPKMLEVHPGLMALGKIAVAGFVKQKLEARARAERERYDPS